MPTAPHGAGRLLDRIAALTTAGAVLHLGAHPDDEDGGLIAYLSRRHRVRTVYWSATRGEGGQNRRGPERAEALGIVRTWESLEAREVDGGEVLYGPFYDFGFSKSGEDTLRRWGRDDTVREVVRAIRLVQPLVVVSRWSGGPTDGHGHHQAVGLVAAEAFDAAGDPARYPELGLPPWRPAKLYRSVAGDWQPGEDGTFGLLDPEHEAAGHLRLDTGEVDPAVGLSYQEQAHLAVNHHRSQGMGFVPEPGPYFYYYRLERSPAPPVGRERSFYDGIDPGLAALADGVGAGWPRLRDRLAALTDRVADAVAAARPDRPDGPVEALVDVVVQLRALRDEAPAAPLDPGAAAALAQLFGRRAAEAEAVLSACLSLRLECLLDRPRATPGQALTATTRVWVGGPGPQAVTVEEARVEAPPDWTVRPEADAPHAAASHDRRWTVTVPTAETPRTPYWLREARTPYAYRWPATSPALAQAVDEPLLTAVATVRLGDLTWELRTPAVHRSGFPGGWRTLPLTVLPPLVLTPRQRREIVPRSKDETVLELDVTVECLQAGGAQARLALRVPEGWTVEPAGTELLLSGDGEPRTVRSRVVVPPGAAAGVHQLDYDVTTGGRSSAVEISAVRLGGAGAPADEDTCTAEAHLVQPAAVVVHVVDVEFVTTLKYAYVRGMEERVLESLGRFGLDLTDLDDEELEYGDLDAYDAIVLGPNAYSVRPAVRRAAQRLLDYTAEGGTLVVQHHGYGFETSGLAPWPVRHSQPHDRVTDAAAPVQVLAPGSPVLHAPNEIIDECFSGWVHDRGMYFLGEWDRRYQPVLASHDVGEEPKAGGLLTTSHGRGTWVYAALSFYRQLPAGVPGALRLFANLLALAEVRVRERMGWLSAVELFSFMTDAQLYEAARTLTERWVDEGSWLARQGEQGRELFLLVEGTVEVVREVPGEPDRILHVARPYEALGELTLLVDTPRSASLRAATDAVVLVLRDDAFHAWLEHHPDLARRMLQVLAMKIIDKDVRR